MMNAKDMLARLLANENLNVIRANVSTASFESISRTLTLPMWKDMSIELEEMLIGHEVGHALFTTIDYIDAPDFRKIQGYMNVIEDVRIEKKIKNRYPGLRKSFITAYKQLVEKDFFQTSDKDLSKILLIDRINLYYKAGFNCGVKFTPEEMDFVRRTDRCDTMKDVYELAQEIYAYSKEEREAKKEEMKKLVQINGEDPEEPAEEIEMDDPFMDDPDDFDNTQSVDSDEEAKTEQQTTEPTPEETAAEEALQEEEDLAPSTQKAFDERLSELADTDTIVQNWDPRMDTTRNPIVPFKQVLADLKFSRAEYTTYLDIQYGNGYGKTHDDRARENNIKFKADSMKVVNYLVKEFEMKKSATEYRRTTTATSGDLASNRLYAYRLTDDIFKKLDIVPEDKNHGMIFLMDWSGSMGNVMSDTIKQVINLAMFCQRIQIPYQVFAFTSGYENVLVDRLLPEQAVGNNAFRDGQFHLLELFSNKMSNTEFSSMMEYLNASPWKYDRKYGLHSTPLNESLIYLADYIGKFIKNNSVEKMSFVTLTDGEGNPVQGVGYRSVRSQTYSSGKTNKVKNYLRDPITKKEYAITEDGPGQTRVFLRVIKDRYNIKTVGFHILSTSRRDIGSFVRHNLPASKTESEKYYLIEELRKEIRQNDYALLKNAGRDELYLLPASKQKIEEGELQVDMEMNAKAIARNFGKFLNVKKSSRVVLNRFVSLIA